MRNIVTRSDGALIRVWRPRRILLTAALALCVASALGMSVTSTHAAAATDPLVANYCNYNVSTESGHCFYSEQELLDYNSVNSPFTYITVYNWINHNTGGGYKTIGGNSACTGPFDNEGKNIRDLARLSYVMPNGSVGPNVNNTITSVITYDSSACWVNLFDGVDYTGPSSGWLSDPRDLSDIGFNNRASSLRIS